jgi:chromosome segregation ATPase
MATLAVSANQGAAGAVGAAKETDNFAALEDKVRRAVEMLKQEREARHAAEAAMARLSESSMGERRRVADLERELEVLRKDRGEVKVRVERLLEQLDELTGA